jgi:hypothetical protein
MKLDLVVKVFLTLVIGIMLGYGWRMYSESQHPTKPGILIQPTDKVKWSIAEVQSYSATARQQKYIAHDASGDVVLLIKSPPMDVWVGDWR